MIKSRIEVPHFATESEEADWWFENREVHGQIMAKAMDEGRTMTMKDLLEQHGMEAPAVTVRVDPVDLERARSQAARRGVSYDDYIRDLLHEALLKNDAA